MTEDKPREVSASDLKFERSTRSPWSRLHISNRLCHTRPWVLGRGRAGGQKLQLEVFDCFCWFPERPPGATTTAHASRHGVHKLVKRKGIL